MSNISIALAEDKSKFWPGEELSGETAWELERAPEKITICLFWKSGGAHFSDIEVFAEHSWETGELSGKRQFKFKLPLAPYSYKGAVSSLSWGLEACAFPNMEKTAIEIVSAPGAEPVALRKGGQ